jgi:hypothetical protein
MKRAFLWWQPPVVTGLDLRRKRVDVHVLDEQGQTVWVGVGSRSRVGREAGIQRQSGLGLGRWLSLLLAAGSRLGARRTGGLEQLKQPLPGGLAGLVGGAQVDKDLASGTEPVLATMRAGAAHWCRFAGCALRRLRL